MKQVTRCYNCKNIIRLSGSFHAEIKEAPEVNGIIFTDMSVTKKIVLCRKCAFNAGYKVKGDEFTPKYVFSASHDPNNPFDKPIGNK